MPQETVKAQEISMGDEIEVDLGRGKTFRPVDNITDHGENIKITLYSEFGRRPTFIVPKTQPVVRRLPE